MGSAQEKTHASDGSYRIFKPTMELLPIVIGPCIGALVSGSTCGCKSWLLAAIIVFTIVIHFYYCLSNSFHSKDLITAEQNQTSVGGDSSGSSYAQQQIGDTVDIDRAKEQMSKNT